MKRREETSREESELRGKGAVREGGKIMMRVGKGERRGGMVDMRENEEGQGGN